MINCVYHLFLFEKKMRTFEYMSEAIDAARKTYGIAALESEQVIIFKLTEAMSKYFGVEPGYAINVEFE